MMSSKSGESGSPKDNYVKFTTKDGSIIEQRDLRDWKGDWIGIEETVTATPAKIEEWFGVKVWPHRGTRLSTRESSPQSDNGEQTPTVS